MGQTYSRAKEGSEAGYVTAFKVGCVVNERVWPEERQYKCFLDWMIYEMFFPKGYGGGYLSLAMLGFPSAIIGGSIGLAGGLVHDIRDGLHKLANTCKRAGASETEGSGAINPAVVSNLEEAAREKVFAALLSLMTAAALAVQRKTLTETEAQALLFRFQSTYRPEDGVDGYKWAAEAMGRKILTQVILSSHQPSAEFVDPDVQHNL